MDPCPRASAHAHMARGLSLHGVTLVSTLFLERATWCRLLGLWVFSSPAYSSGIAPVHLSSSSPPPGYTRVELIWRLGGEGGGGVGKTAWWTVSELIESLSLSLWLCSGDALGFRGTKLIIAARLVIKE